jgi:hypothetical protein
MIDGGGALRFGLAVSMGRLLVQLLADMDYVDVKKRVWGN